MPDKSWNRGQRELIVEAVDEWRKLSGIKRYWMRRWAKPYYLSGFNLCILRVLKGLASYGKHPYEK